MGALLTASVSALAIVASAGGTPEVGAESCLSQRRSPCVFRYDVSWNVTTKSTNNPVLGASSQASFDVKFEGVRISGSLTGKRVSMSGETLRPSKLKVRTEYGAPECSTVAREFVHPVTLHVTTAASPSLGVNSGTFFAGYQSSAPDPSLNCEGLRLSNVTQWDVGCGSRPNRNPGVTCREKSSTTNMVHGGTAFQGASTSAFKKRATPSRLPFPLDRLWNGKSFVVTGQTVYTPTFAEGASQSSTVRLTFTRRR
jgi:hypothetical protein